MSRSPHVLENTRWRAVQQRDKSTQSTFIYAVLTTRIFCRPTCPARLARRANVVFFDSAADATVAGFRPCKRCKPMHQDLDSDVHGVARTVNRACEFIRSREGHVLIGEVANHVGFSVRHMYGSFKKTVGYSPAAYALHVRESNSQRGVTEVGRELELRVDPNVDYGSPSTYVAMEKWTWDGDHDLLALTESCTSVMSSDSMTPVFTDSPESVEWTDFIQPDACWIHETTMELHLDESLDFDLNKVPIGE